MHPRHGYGLLAPEEPEESEGSQSNTGTWVRSDSHRDKRGTEQMETETGVGTGQRALLACGMQEKGN